MFRIDSGFHQVTEGSQSTASFFHPLESPRGILLTPAKQKNELLYIKPTQVSIPESLVLMRLESDKKI